MNVLLADDEPMMRRMLRLTMQKAGFRVFEASNAADALTLFARQPIDMLVTDIVMQDMDGWALARAVQQQNPNLPVLFISGHDTDFDGQRQHYGRCAFLLKPFHPTELLSAIAKLAAVTE